MAWSLLSTLMSDVDDIVVASSVVVSVDVVVGVVFDVAVDSSVKSVKI